MIASEITVQPQNPQNFPTGAASVPHGAAPGGHLQGQDGRAATARPGTAAAAAAATTASNRSVFWREFQTEF